MRVEHGSHLEGTYSISDVEGVSSPSASHSERYSSISPLQRWASEKDRLERINLGIGFHSPEEEPLVRWNIGQAGSLQNNVTKIVAPGAFKLWDPTHVTSTQPIPAISGRIAYHTRPQAKVIEEQVEEIDWSLNDIQPQDPETERIIRPEEYFCNLEALEEVVFNRSLISDLSAAPSGIKDPLDDIHVPHRVIHGYTELSAVAPEWQKALARLSPHISNMISSLKHLKEKGFCGSYISLIILDQARPSRVAKLVALPHSIFQDFRDLIQRAQVRAHSFSAHSALTLIIIREIDIMCQSILSRLGLSKEPNEMEPQRHKIEGQAWLWNTVTEVLDLALMSYAGAHVADFDRTYLGVHKDQFVIPAYTNVSLRAGDWRPKVYMYRKSMLCLEKLLHRQVWVFSSEPNDGRNDRLYLSSNIETFADMWGPLWKCVRSSNREQIYELRVGNGSIVPWKLETGGETNVLGGSEIFCHWTSMRTPSAVIENIQQSLKQPYFSKTDTLLIGALEGEDLNLVTNEACRRSNDEIKQTMSELHGLNDFKTARGARYKDSQTIQVQGGGLGLTVGTTIAYKNRDGLTRKEALVERWRNSMLCNPVTLEIFGGLEISVCTRNARRVRLLELLSTDTMQLFLRGVGFTWKDGLEKRYYRALKSPKRFRELWADESVRDNIREAVSLCLDLLDDTGVDEQTGELQAFWVVKAAEAESDGGSDTEGSDENEQEKYNSNNNVNGQNQDNWEATEEYLFSIYRSEHTWTRFLKDTRQVMTMAVVENSCLESCQEHARRCAAWRTEKNGRIVRRVGGFPVLQTSIQVNEQFLKSDSITKIEPEAGRPYWDLTNLQPKSRFLLGEQGILEVLQVPKPNHKRSKGKEKVGDSPIQAEHPRPGSQIIVVEWYGVKSETLQEVKDVEIQQTFYGSNPKKHHTEAISIGLLTRPIPVLILSDSHKIR